MDALEGATASPSQGARHGDCRIRARKPRCSPGARSGAASQRGAAALAERGSALAPETLLRSPAKR